MTFTVQEVAERLRRRPRTVLSRLRQGQLVGFREGRDWRIQDRDLDAFIRSSTNQPSRSLPVALRETPGQTLARLTSGNR